MDASGSCAPQQTSLITKVSGGDFPGQSCTRGDALREQRFVIQASGHTTGSVVLLPSSTLFSFRKNSMLTNRPASCQAHLRSHSGRNAGVA